VPLTCACHQATGGKRDGHQGGEEPPGKLNFDRQGHGCTEAELTQNIEAFSSLDLRRLATSEQNAQPASVCASAVPEATHGTPLAVAVVSLVLFLSLPLSLFPFATSSTLSLPPCLPTLPFSLPQPLFPPPPLLPSLLFFPLSPLTCFLSLFLYKSTRQLLDLLVRLCEIIARLLTRYRVPY